MKVNIEEKKNGWVVSISGGIYFTGEHVFKADEILKMIEFIGEALANGKVKVTWR